MLTPDEIKVLRQQLGMSQGTLASLLGVHGVTVSKWECGRSAPNKAHDERICVFAQAEQRVPGIGKSAAFTLTARGVARALYELLGAAYTGKEMP